MKIALGCVQFGLNYGVTNQQGQVQPNMVAAILRQAAVHGIDTLDTAALYGNSESVLGETLKTSSRFKLITKLGHISTQEEVRPALLASLARLKQSKIKGLLLHRPDVLFTSAGAGIASELESLKSSGLIQQWGVSVYNPLQAEQLLQRFNFDLIQLPLNLFDQRFIRAGTLSMLKAQGIEIHARSLLLQGLLCHTNWPAFFHPWQGKLKQLHHQAQQQGISLIELALSFCHQNSEVERFVLGCQSQTQLNEIVAAYRSTQDIKIDYQELACFDEDLILPSKWPS